MYHLSVSPYSNLNIEMLLYQSNCLCFPMALANNSPKVVIRYQGTIQKRLRWSCNILKCSFIMYSVCEQLCCAESGGLCGRGSSQPCCQDRIQSKLRYNRNVTTYRQRKPPRQQACCVVSDCSLLLSPRFTCLQTVKSMSTMLSCLVVVVLHSRPSSIS
jgi:hypothetical protein